MFVVAAAFVLVGAVMLVAWQFNPGLYHDGVWVFRQRRCGFKRRFLSLHEAQRWSYMEVDGQHTAPTLVLVHGFTSEALHWADFIYHLGYAGRVIAIDLPGHGHSSGDLDANNLTIPGLVVSLRDFMVAMSLHDTPVHMLGISLGGAVVGAYSALHPSNIVSTSLLCPAGIDSEIRSEFLIELERTRRNLLSPGTVEDFSRMLDLVFHARPMIPRRMQAFLVERMQPKREFYDGMLLQLAEPTSRFYLQDVLPQLATPLRLFWGDNDKVLDISSVAVVKQHCPHAEVVVLKNCGHAMPYELPCESAAHVRQWLDMFSR